MKREEIIAAIPDCLAETDLPLPNKYRGKVRDTYDLGDGRLVLVTTDRQSGFDRYLGAIPFKGQVLNRASLHWFEATKGIIGNHVLSSPHANALIAKKCRILPIEFVVRGYLTGSTDTSVWTKYAGGARDYCGHALPDGMRKNEKLRANIVTPTTKEATHDRPLSPAEIIAEGWLTSAEWEFASAKALELFTFGQAKAAERGLILVDTKYEFGVDASGEIILCDEIHTPDSSRWWIAESYAARLAAGREPEMIDKEFFRLWFRERCDPYKDAVLPTPPDDLVAELAARYIRQFEMMTGVGFVADGRDLSDPVLKALSPRGEGWVRGADTSAKPAKEKNFGAANAATFLSPSPYPLPVGERVLIVGSGAREHAIAEALARSKEKPRLICFGSANNPGIARLCDGYAVGGMEDAVGIAAFANAERATLAVIGPEAPLAAGVADALWEADVPTVGPRRDLAQIESSKGFTRDLLARHGIPGNPFFWRFTSMDGVEDVLRKYAGRHVIKDDGLAGGKGVKVFGDHLHSHEESVAFCQDILTRGGSFVVEEKLEGQEFSLLCFCDGKSQRYMPVVQDHKRAFEGDKGPNTGGMGTYTDATGKNLLNTLPFLKIDDVEEAWEISEAVCRALRQDFGPPYQGILYGGFMATAEGVKLIEYNARFGDPEVLNLLTLLESDFLNICRAIVGQRLDRTEVKFRDEASVCKYIVPEGYPDAPRKGDAIELPRDVKGNVRLYLGAVDERDGKLIATGSRTLGIVGTGATIAEAEAACQRVADQVTGPFFHRRDIGTASLIDSRVEHMERLRIHKRVKMVGRGD